MLEANTPHLRKRAYQVRFDVFGREKRWEDEGQQAYDERDEYDAAARHGLLVERGEGLDIGTVRVVIPGTGSPQRFAMPIQSHISGGLLNDTDIVAIVCEASRFCVVEDYRRRFAESLFSIGMTGGSSDPGKRRERRVLPFAPLALIQFIIRCALEERRPVVSALMEPFLIGMLSKFGILFLPIAPPVEFRGTRYPCVLSDVLNMFERMRTTQPLVWEVVTDGGVLHDLALEVIPPMIDDAVSRKIERSTDEYRSLL